MNEKSDLQNQSGESLENDVCFILTSAFLIFTMQTGYGLLESGIVSRKNEVNILLKNAVNIICGTLAFWAFGFAFSSQHNAKESLQRDLGKNNIFENRLAFKHTPHQPNGLYPFTAAISNHHDHHLYQQRLHHSNGSNVAQFFRVHIFSWDRFFVNVPTSADRVDTTYVEFAFQLAYATTCTAIISGAMAERCRFISFFIFSLFNNFLFCLPARWIMFDGWLNRKGVIDIGGSGTVHLVGGCAGIVAALLLGPRLGRFDSIFKHVPMGNPTNALHGLILLWWGWLGYSAGSSFGITNEKWKYSARASVVTALASMGGGAFGMLWSAVTQSGLQNINLLLDAILASLVAISGGAPIIRPVYSIVIGIIGSFLALITIPLLEKLKIDDPTNSFPVHAVAGAWGLIAIGIFAEQDSVVHYRKDYHQHVDWTGDDGNLRKYLLLAQLYAIGVLVLWSVVVTLILLLPIYFTIGLRMSIQEEILGPDYVEHGLVHEGNLHLLKMVQQKITKVNSGMTETQASAEVVARYATPGNTRKRSLASSHSADMWSKAKSTGSPNQFGSRHTVHRRFASHKQHSGSSFSVKSMWAHHTKRNNSAHVNLAQPQPPSGQAVWSTGMKELTVPSTSMQQQRHQKAQHQLQRYLQKAEQMTTRTFMHYPQPQSSSMPTIED